MKQPVFQYFMENIRPFFFVAPNIRLNLGGQMTPIFCGYFFLIEVEVCWSDIFFLCTLLVTNISHQKSLLSRWFSQLPQVGYVSSLEGTQQHPSNYFINQQRLAGLGSPTLSSSAGGQAEGVALIDSDRWIQASEKHIFEIWKKGGPWFV